MPCFKCSKCDTVENTATSDYWTYHIGKKPALCSECGSGQWHGKFEKMSAKGWYYDEDGFIYHPDEVDVKKMQWKYNGKKIIGKFED